MCFSRGWKIISSNLFRKALVWVIKMMQLHRIKDSIHGIDLNKTDKWKECKICHYNYFSKGFKYQPNICNDCDWGIKYFGNFAVKHVNDVGCRFVMFDMT